MEKLLMLGSAKESKEILIRAKEKGYYTIVTDYDSPDKSRAKLIADEYWMISTNDFDQLERKCIDEKINGVITGISTFNILASIELCRRLNLPCYTNYAAWEYTIDKRKFKDICIKNNVKVAQDYYLHDFPRKEEIDSIDYPVVVKAIDQSANRGMSYCNNSDELLNAIKYAQSFSKSKTVITEHMLKGHEYTARYALAAGESSLVDFCVMLNQPGYPSNCYSLTTTCTNMFKNYLNNFDSNFKNALKDMGCNEGYAWVEIMADTDHTLNALEMGYRMAGDMFENQMAKAGQFDAINWLLEIAMGKKHKSSDLPLSLKKLPKRIVSSYILWSKEAGIVKEIIGLDKIEAINNITIQQDAFVGSSFKKHQYLFVITFDTADVYELINVIKLINENVKILDENNSNVVIYFDDFDTLLQMNNSKEI